jgi:glucokinase
MRAVLGIDIGGTAIKLGLVAADGRLIARDQLSVDRGQSFEPLMDRLAASCRGIEQKSGLAADRIGVATPGHVDAASGILVDGAVNIPQLMGKPVRQAIASRLGRPVAIENDGTAATMGELRYGAGRGLRRFALVVFGTGVGGGIAIDGRVISGARGEPPELGAMVLDPSAVGPGGRSIGTFEHLTAASGFVRAYARFGGRAVGVTAEELFERAQQQEAAALQAIDATARFIAQAFGTLINALNLEACIIGGGLAAAGELLAGPVRRHLPDFTWPLLLAGASVRIAETGNDAGVLGAAALAEASAEGGPAY